MFQITYNNWYNARYIFTIKTLLGLYSISLQALNFDTKHLKYAFIHSFIHSSTQLADAYRVHSQMK